MLALVLWQSPDLLSIAIAVSCAALAGVLWLYPPQIVRQGRRGRGRWMLPALRVVAILALAVSLLRPVAARTTAAAPGGPIVVLVDQSRSMGVSDSGRTPGERVALAEGLGLISAGPRPRETAALRAELENLRVLIDRIVRTRSEADYARLSGRGAQAAAQRLEQRVSELRGACAAVASRAASLRDAGELAALVEGFRAAPAVLDERALRELRARADRAVAGVMALHERADQQAYRSDAHLRDVCDELDGLPRLELARRGLAKRLPAGQAFEIYGFGDGVRSLQINSPTWSAQDNRSDIGGAIGWVARRSRTQAVQAIVLVSDGRQVGGETPSPSAIPVFAVAAAAERQARDVAVTRIWAPTSAYAGETATVRVEIAARGCEGEPVELQLDCAGVRQTKLLTIGKSPMVSAEFEVTFARAEPTELIATVSALAGEATERNNRGETWVKVLPEKLEVMIASGNITRDFHLMSEALAAAPWVNLHQTVLSGDADLLPLSPAEILNQNVIVLSDVRVWSLSDQQWDAVGRLVNERGGGVILQVSDPQVLRDYAEHPVIAKLLPFDPTSEIAWRSWPGDQPRFALAPPGERGIRPGWEKLAAVTRFAAMPQMQPNAQALLVERESGAAALAETHVGLGRALLVGVDETWRWYGFWPAVVQRAAGELYAGHIGNLWLDVAKLAVEPGEAVAVRARVLREDGTPSRADTQEVQIFRDGQVVRTITLWPAAQGGGRFETTISDLGEGHYELRLNTTDDLITSPRVPLRVMSGEAGELANLTPDTQLLRQIAESSGGQFLTLEQLASLPRRLRDVREREGETSEYPLWDSPWLFLFVVGCLSLEWALRKQVGLA